VTPFFGEIGVHRLIAVGHIKKNVLRPDGEKLAAYIAHEIEHGKAAAPKEE